MKSRRGAGFALFLVACSLVAVLALSGCGGSADEGPVQTNRVDLPKSYRFEPAVIEIAAGARVTWTDHDDLPPQRPFARWKRSNDRSPARGVWVHRVRGGRNVRL
jgi:hypothetical protein